jgi:hypothetical protein
MVQGQPSQRISKVLFQQNKPGVMMQQGKRTARQNRETLSEKKKKNRVFAGAGNMAQVVGRHKALSSSPIPPKKKEMR